jgi:hypothetical protein
VSHSSDRPDYLLHHLVALRDTYALSALVAHGDPARTSALTDEYLRDATVLMSAAYGRDCADQVRASAPRASREPAPDASWLVRAARALRRGAVDAIRRNAQEWHHQTLGMAGAW